MSQRARRVLGSLGLVLHVPAAMALTAVPLCILFEDGGAATPFVGLAVVGFAVGQILFRGFRSAGELELRDAMLVAALGWFVVPLLGALPLVLTAIPLAALPGSSETIRALADPWSALFEAFSGFTSTGLTMCVQPGDLPRVLQWWRSLMQWVGGVGVIVMMLSLVRPTISAHRLYRSEGRTEKIAPSVKSTVRSIGWIYLLYTALGIALLRISGASGWEALNHGLTAIATGGFTVTAESARSFPVPVRLALLVVVVLGAVSFGAHARAIRERRPAALWADSQHRMLWGLLVAGCLLVIAENAWFDDGIAPLDGVFQWVSALSTAGFQSADLAQWSTATKLLLAAAMVIGGAAGSTAGGIKLLRLVLLLRGLQWRFRAVVRTPHELVRYELDGRDLSESQADRAVEAAGILALLWLAVLGGSVFVLLHVVPASFSLADVILEAASAQGNVGLSSGITSAGLPVPGKLTLVAAMWIGRLEIFPVMVLLTPTARRRGRR